ncbi:MAG TPA: hypothetical protein VFB54_14510 [Burkholderiales bacterium]|nr:hypothetical protein [Burkholderiales bacterium]
MTHNASRSLGLLLICVLAMISWVAGLEFQLGPYISEDVSTTSMSAASDDATD